MNGNQSEERKLGGRSKSCGTKKKGRRGRPSGSVKKKKTPSKSTPATTGIKLEEIICIDTSGTDNNSTNDTISILDTSITDSLENRSFCLQTGGIPNLKEARVVLTNVLDTDLISSKQRKELINKNCNTEHILLESKPLEMKRKKRKSKGSSISSTTTDSSVIFIGQISPVVPMIYLEKIKVEPLNDTPKNRPCRNRRSDKSVKKQSLEKKSMHCKNKLSSQCSNTSKGSTDKISIHSSSSEKSEEKNHKKKLMDTKRPECGNNEKAKKPRSKNSSDEIELIRDNNNCNYEEIRESPNKNEQVNRKMNGIEKGEQRSDLNVSTKTPSKNHPSTSPLKKSPQTPNFSNSEPHCDNFGSISNGNLGSEDDYKESPILSPYRVKTATTLSSNTRANIEVLANIRSPPMLCNARAVVEIRATDRSPSMSFTSGGEIPLGLDEKDCCLDSIAQAIEKDLASGNRLSPIGDCLENIEMRVDLSTDACCLRNVINESTPPERLQQDKKKPRAVSSRSSESHETSSNISASTDGRNSLKAGRKRRRPTIVNEDIFPRGTITVAPDLSPPKKRRRIHSPIAYESPLKNEKINQNSLANENNTDCSLTGQIVVNSPSDLQTWSKPSEISVLLQDDTTNIQLNTKSGSAICYDDALNNNQEVNFANKNTLNSEKQDERIMLYTSTEASTLDFMGEIEALSGLLNTLDPQDSNEVNSTPKNEDYLEIDTDEREIDEAIELFTASIASSSERKIKQKEESKPVASLSIDNVDKLDYLTSSKDRKSLDAMKSGSDSTNLRKRKWCPGDNIKSPPAAKRKVRLDRKHWVNQDANEQSDASFGTGAGSAQLKNWRITSKISSQQPKKVEVKVDNYSQRVIDKTVTNCNFQKPSMPMIDLEERNGNFGGAVPGFGVEEKKKTIKDTHTDESSESSSSESSSSSSSSSDSSNTEAQHEKPPARVEKPDNSSSNICVSAVKSQEICTITNETEIQRGLESGNENEKAAGSFNEIDFGKRKNVDEDEEDCISLFAESLYTSRCSNHSVPLREVQKRTGSPHYKRMKYENIDPFLNANKQECDAVFEAYMDKLDNDKVGKNNDKQITAVVLSPIAQLLPDSGPTNEIQMPSTAQAVNKPDLRLTLNGKNVRDMHALFRGQCFRWLRSGVCNNQLECRFKHILKPQLQHINVFNMQDIEEILIFAINNRYRFFIEVVHSKATSKMTMEKILLLYNQLYRAQLLTDLIITNTADILLTRGFSLKEIVSSFDSFIIDGDKVTPSGIIRSLYKRIETGSCWEILGKVMSRIVPPSWLIARVMDECIKERKSKEHVADVYKNLVKDLPANLLASIHVEMMKEFKALLEVRDTPNESCVNAVDEQREILKNVDWPCSIASPDSEVTSASPTPPEELTVVEKSMTALTSSPKVLKTGGYKVAQKPSKATSASGSRRSSTDKTSSTYFMPPIDNLPPPRSPYRDVMWKFHWDLQGVQEGLKHRDYTHVISILTQNIKHPSRLPHMNGFYNILCQEIMSSKHHMAEIVRLTVQSGVSNDLRQFVFDLGVFVLTKLADIGAWVLAYELLKTFQVYGTYNTCAYTLLAVEICIANYRPLKALALLKQSQLLFTNPKVWNQMRCPNDEPLRVTVMELLLRSLCDGHAQHALAFLEFILGDQCSSFKPINVSRHVERIARALLAQKHTGSIIDFGRLIMQFNLSISRSTFRALINFIFHSDQILAKQLHSYATWLGAYSTVKISRTTHMIVNDDWTEEEMYLMFSSLIRDLSTNIGHAIGRLRPRQLAVFLILETVPSEKHLCLDICDGPTTNTAINKRKAIVRSVLERFDPKIKLVQKSQGRLCKIQSTSLVDYLKAGHFDH